MPDTKGYKHIHSEYIIFIDFSLQQAILRSRLPPSHFYIACHVQSILISHFSVKTMTNYLKTYFTLCATSGFRREVAENCVLLGHYAAISGNFLPLLAE